MSALPEDREHHGEEAQQDLFYEKPTNAPKELRLTPQNSSAKAKRFEYSAKFTTPISMGGSTQMSTP